MILQLEVIVAVDVYTWHCHQQAHCLNSVTTVYIILQWICGLSLPFSEHTNTGWIYLVVVLEFELRDESTMQAQLQSKIFPD